MKRTLLACACVALAGLWLTGCTSKLKDELPTTPVNQVIHPSGWKDTASPDFHGAAIAAKGGDFTECKTCHGQDLLGGISGKSCAASGCHGSGYHPTGFGDAASPNFHRILLRASGDDLTKCRSCHSADYSGTALSNMVSCNNAACHIAADGGPEACYTCHGDRASKKPYPQVPGTHITHLEGAGDFSTRIIACAGCHTVPTKLSDPGHLDGANPNGAEVSITDTLANTVTIGKTGSPTFDPATETCANVYCHGNFTNGNNFSPKWTGTEQNACGTCHGDATNPRPKGTHPAVDACAACHSDVVDANRNIIDKAKHINGILNVFGTERTNW